MSESSDDEDRMQNLRDQLLKAGIITEDEHRSGSTAKAQKQKNKQPQQQGQQQQPKKDKPKKRSTQGPVLPTVDVSNPQILRIMQAIEQHRLREETKGDVQFHFATRDGRVRKMFVRPAIAEGLEEGRLAIVERGDPEQHIIVAAAAVPLIRDVDPEAVRFFNV